MLFLSIVTFSIDRHSKEKTSKPKFVKINSMCADSLNIFCNDIKDSIKKNTTWNNDLFHDSIDNYGTFEKLIADAKTRRYKASTVCSNRYKHNISHWPHPEFYGLFNSVTKFIGISNLPRPIQKITIPWIIILKHTISSLKIIQQAKIDYNANLFNQSKSNIRHTWSVVKLNKCKNKREFPNYFVIDGHEIKAHTDISNCFNVFFSRALALTLLIASILLTCV